jgi:hypothetical protein
VSLFIRAVILKTLFFFWINKFYRTNTLVFVLLQNDWMWYPVTGKNSSLHPTLCVSVSVSIQWTQISTNHNAQKLHVITTPDALFDIYKWHAWNTLLQCFEEQNTNCLVIMNTYCINTDVYCIRSSKHSSTLHQIQSAIIINNWSIKCNVGDMKR